MHPPDGRGARDLLPPTLLLLTVTTGLVEAVSFLGLGHIFTANMTGNVVLLAFAVAVAAGGETLTALAWPLAIACGAAAIATGVYLLRPLPAALPARTSTRALA